MKIETFLFNTIVKTGREARDLVSAWHVKIYNSNGMQIASAGMEIYSSDVVYVLRNKTWVSVAHPLTAGDT